MEPPIHIRREGRAGRITLNRPKALNAMTYQMALVIDAALDTWRNDPEVGFILIDAVGDRAFCAGGDIAELYATGRAGDFAYGQRFWADEYRLNLKIARYPKPYVAIMDGIVMGGGVGISAHGSHRIVTGRTMLAMPECGIGLVPDVGGSLILGRAPGHSGEWLGLTGSRIGAADAIATGFADVFVPEEQIEALKSALVENGTPDCINDFAATPPPGRLSELQPDIDRFFSGATVRDIRDALQAAPEQSCFVRESLEALRRGSPLSLACALDLIRRARRSDDLGIALKGEYRFVARCMKDGDFLEGIRAQVIDKDRNPKWRHAGPGSVSGVEVASMLAVAPGGDLVLEGRKAS